MELVLDLRIERIAGPGLGERLSRVPLAKRWIPDLRDQRDNVEPGQLVSRLLTNSPIRALRGKEPHIFQTRGGQPLHVWESSAADQTIVAQ
jgi:hypothetical protein